MSSPLASRLRRDVSAPFRTRGEIYFRSGRVAVVESDPRLLVTTVRGTQHYRVSLRVEGDALLADCSCPVFTDTAEPCKHVWASILAADRSGSLDATGVTYLDGEAAVAVMESLFGDAPADDLPDRTAALARGSQRPIDTPPAWQRLFAQVAAPGVLPVERPSAAGELLYVVDLQRSAGAGGVLIELMQRQQTKTMEWGKPKAASIRRTEVLTLPEPDRRILSVVCGADSIYSGMVYAGVHLPVPQAFALNVPLQRTLMPHLCGTGRLMLRIPASADRADGLSRPIVWEPDAFSFVLRIDGDETAGYTLRPVLRSTGDERAPTDALLLTAALVLWPPATPDGPLRFAALDPAGGERWLSGLLDVGPVTVPPAEVLTLMEQLALSPLSTIDGPPELRAETVVEPPQPIIRIRQTRDVRGRPVGPADRLEVEVAFAYGGQEVNPAGGAQVLFDRERRRAIRRDAAAEEAALARVRALGVRRRPVYWGSGSGGEVSLTRVPALVRTLLSEGWQVETDGRLHRRPGAVSVELRTGIDWFELHGSVDFDGVRAPLPTLLAALRRGDAFVALEDGTLGQLPEEWLARGGRIASLGAVGQDHVRFARSQAALLDAWLATQPEATCDAQFDAARAELARFSGVTPLDPPPSFTGVLRDYQRDALGWFDFLRRFGFGGCLADEMGLGKTVMVLAALDARRLARERDRQPPLPSLIVLPRSLVFNWREEARRFAPRLRVLDCTGAGRRDAVQRIGEHDVVLTTYGTLRRDIGHLKEIPFDYAVLDEAQAVKNARTGTAKAVRLVQAQHRLALSGTPVENHLGELWSLFDFLNPGMLGTASVFAGATGSRRTLDDETVGLLARGLRPFILRRTKDQVAAELPPRTEQTLYCDLEPAQRALYDELREHYRTELLRRVERDGLGRAKLHVLEALLRLRQAACHPGLLDRTRAQESSAKLDVLLPRLQELVEDGRKVLVFSQFTSLLGLLRSRLDEAGLAYAYLDGRTKDRAARVRAFQDDDCPLFLISLKAGGQGLNLTAAEYVFLLDPWWNPAAEAQAIDRAHRIGQVRPVFAFRLIARDTVEEKVLELQATKRRLADAIVRADESLIRELRREDLELLLS